ncbi:two-component system, OmpR family, response regulator [Thiomicrospira sp. ALE5]|nr:two-component system, OmpR family, response regulator [Thiomicrospira sp. ALE5]
MLLVEDDPNQAEAISEALHQAQFRVLCANNAQQALAHFDAHHIVILISDIILGHEFDGGFMLAKTIRQQCPSLPIIFLSERRDADDIWQGHQLGALDYLPKPLFIPLLVQKLHNLLQVTQGRLMAKTLEPESSVVDVRLTIVTNEAKVSWQNQSIQLTLTEFEMLTAFANQPAETVVTYDALRHATQGVVERNTINTHICRIRQAFRKVDTQFDAIQNVYGRGYKWRR